MRIAGVVFFLFYFQSLVAQVSDVTVHFVSQEWSKECHSEVRLPLFSKHLNRDSINRILINRLADGYYDTRILPLSLFYRNAILSLDTPLMFDVKASCNYAANDIYSFTACPFNYCTQETQSNFTTNMVTIDLKKNKPIEFDDLFDDGMKDSLNAYVYLLAQKYRVKNLPTCYYTSIDPVKMRTSNPLLVQQDVVFYEKRLVTLYHLSGNMIALYLRTNHTAYNYFWTEIMLPISAVSKFMKEEYRQRLGN
jgi:hypothetical protein